MVEDIDDLSEAHPNEFLTTSSAVAQSEALRERVVRERDRQRSSEERFTLPDALRIEISEFVLKTMRSGALFPFPEDRLVLQTLVTTWRRTLTRASDSEDLDVATRHVLDQDTTLLDAYRPKHELASLAIKAQREEQLTRDLQVRAARWQRLWAISPDGAKEGLLARLFGRRRAFDSYLMDFAEYRFVRRSPKEIVPSDFKFASGAILSARALFWTLVALAFGLILWNAAVAQRTAHDEGERAEAADINRLDEQLNDQERSLRAQANCQGYADAAQTNACLVGAIMANPNSDPDNPSRAFFDAGLADEEVPTFARIAPAPPPASTSAGAECVGWVWLGREGSFGNIVRPPETSLDRAWLERPWQVERTLQIRAEKPTSENYDAGQVLGQVSTGRTMNLIALPEGIDRAEGDQFWGHVSAAPENCVTVFIQFTGVRDRARELRELLRGRGYVAPGVELVSTPPNMAEIRYFRQSDRVTAETIALLLEPSLSRPLTSRYIELPNIRTPRPALEVWVDLR